VTTDADRVTVLITVSGSGGGGAMEEGTGLGGAKEGYIKVKQSTRKEQEAGNMYHAEKKVQDKTKRVRQNEQTDIVV